MLAVGAVVVLQIAVGLADAQEVGVMAARERVCVRRVVCMALLC